MPANTFGELFRLTTFGESHGPAIGGVIDGCPAGLQIDRELLKRDLGRRRPGQSQITTARNEEDEIEFLSGIFEETTTGAPIAFLIRNRDQRSSDYSNTEHVYRPSHADMTYDSKYGIRDHRGGGRSSARETAARVAGGAIAKMLLAHYGISVTAFVRQVGNIALSDDYDKLDLSLAEMNEVRCPDPDVAEQMRDLILRLRDEGDSTGGVIQCVMQGLPAGLGEPVFDKFHAVLAHAMMSINATRAFEIGSGLAGAQMYGSAHNDAFTTAAGKVRTATNHSGGVQGGISNGMPVYFNVAFKPVASISREQQTVNDQGEPAMLSLTGRHDPCVVPRAVVIVESMAALVCADMYLRLSSSRLK